MTPAAGIGAKTGRHRDWTEARAKCDREDGCRICGEWPVESSHIVPRSLGGGMHADEIVPLCRTHHTMYDDHDLDLLPHLTIEEQVAAVRVLGLARAYRHITGERPTLVRPVALRGIA